MRIVKDTLFFDWNKGNSEKNKKHGVDDEEAEEPFIDEHKVVMEDAKHSLKERRYLLLGKTIKERKLAVIFTMRREKIRIISARDMNKKERKVYEESI